MTLAIGTDLVEIQRIADAVESYGEKFAQRILTERELVDYRARNQNIAFLAKRFAAKEAIAKALGTGIAAGVSFQDITISNNSAGVPQVTLQGVSAELLESLGGTRVLLSLSDEKRYALAYALLV